MTSGRLRAALVITLIVVCSAIVGAALERNFFHQRGGRGRGGGPGGGPGRGSQDGGDRRRAAMLDRMTKSLDLTPVQRAGIDSVMRTTDSLVHAIRTEMQPRLEQVFEGSRTQINARLTPEQREKFAKSRGGGGGRGPRL